MSEQHTVKSFGEQLEALSALVAQMGGLAEAQFAAAIEAIARRDSVAAERAVGGDTRIDQIQQEIEERALKLLGEHPGCAYVAVWEGERPLLERRRSEATAATPQHVSA